MHLTQEGDDPILHPEVLLLLICLLLAGSLKFSEGATIGNCLAMLLDDVGCVRVDYVLFWHRVLMAVTHVLMEATSGNLLPALGADDIETHPFHPTRTIRLGLLADYDRDDRSFLITRPAIHGQFDVLPLIFVIQWDLTFRKEMEAQLADINPITVVGSLAGFIGFRLSFLVCHKAIRSLSR